jgi:hypothetical protein
VLFLGTPRRTRDPLYTASDGYSLQCIVLCCRPHCIYAGVYVLLLLSVYMRIYMFSYYSVSTCGYICSLTTQCIHADIYVLLLLSVLHTHPTEFEGVGRHSCQEGGAATKP